MSRSIICIAIGLILSTAVATPVFADDPAPTAEQLEQAKKAYGEGKALHDQGKLPEAIDKFKESYRLSKNPLLLYNIGFTLDEAGQKDLALFYFRKFLADAPQEAKQRAEVADRVKALEKEFMDRDLNGTTSGHPAVEAPTSGHPAVEAPKPIDKPKHITIKPAGTYSATDFQHQVVEEAPPNKPLDVTAFVPEDSGFTVTLYFRGAGDSTFTSKLMKWRYKELVGRIPAAKMAGSSIQYYVEVKDQTGNVVTRSGKATSPNLVNLEPTATARFYPDGVEDPDVVATEPTARRAPDEEDPLHRHRDDPPSVELQPAGPEVAGNGLTDVGSSKFRYAKLGTTISAGVMLGLAIVFYVEAGSQSKHLSDDSTMCGSPPCRGFDSFDQDVQSAGQRDQTLSRVTFALGLASAGVAAYFWYRELTAKKHGETRMSSAAGGSPETSWLLAPTVGQGFAGAAASGSF